MFSHIIDRNNAVLVNAQDISLVYSPRQYKEELLSYIKNAESRIYITALYLQDDEAGREVLDALYAAKQQRPHLDICVFVDAHRARRGLIGEKEHEGNRALYLEYQRKYAVEINIYGVAVKPKELFGVLHLKGMIFDDTVFFTGASINDIYLHQHDKYRLDRYYSVHNATLADSFVRYLDVLFVETNLAPLLNKEYFPDPQRLKEKIAQLRRLLVSNNYKISGTLATDSKEDISSDVGQPRLLVEPIVGFGRRKNPLNAKIRKLVQQSEHHITMFTPYFNFPKVLIRDVAKALKRGVKIEITVGDKTANDFYIHDTEKFSTIGIVPYVYEILLVRFTKRWKKYIDNGQLVIRLWKHDKNSYHLKGIIVDQTYHLITGSNINPRAWALDLENGLLIEDQAKQLMPKVERELELIYENTRIVDGYQQLDSIKDYPEKPQKLLNKLRMTQIDKILKRLL